MLLKADNLLTDKHTSIVNKLNAAFLICLSGENHPNYKAAYKLLNQGFENPDLNNLAIFFLRRLTDIEEEITSVENSDTKFQSDLSNLKEYLSHPVFVSDRDFNNKVWQLFFPEAVGVLESKHQYADALRKLRIVDIDEENPNPILEPGQEILFTSNVLLTIPHKNTDIDSLNYDNNIKQVLKQAANEPQLYWFDHPIQIGVAPEANEILYGLVKLDESLETEKERGNLKGDKVQCLLSVSVTHKSLHGIAKGYIQQELSHNGSLKNLEVYIFTENDTQKLINEILLPIAKQQFNLKNAKELLQVFGVDGEYGRHYCFLKAIAAFWNVLINPEVKATFKIDLDQVFPQKELVEQTGKSAFEHFRNHLWGAIGIGHDNKELELGMIAGALVNEKDIIKGIYTPDVTYPETIPNKEANVFFSKLMMALSTETELMTRYEKDSIVDGKQKCIQRIHVTGGTNGILVDALRRHRPFTPSFIARAEDQAYIMSVLIQTDKPRLAYLHEDGLIMRHDKEAFATQAMKAAKFGNIVGDYIRLLYFSAYARLLTDDLEQLKEILNPFTGCFISRIPITVCMLRFALKGADFFEKGNNELGQRFLTENVWRLDRAIEFIQGRNSKFKQQLEFERKGWKLYYDILGTIEKQKSRETLFIKEIFNKARHLTDACKIDL